MQAVSETYTRLLHTPGVIRQHKAVIGGAEYGQAYIVGVPATYNSLYGKENGPALGQMSAGEVDISIIPQGDIPRMAEIRLFTRIARLDYVSQVVLETSEWLQKGVFLLDTRRRDSKTGALVLKGYDRMLLGEDFFLHEGDELGTWPRPMDEVVDTICQRIGVTLSADTAVRHDYMVPFPEVEGLTMREMLGYAAACHAANATITDSGELRFVPLFPAGDAVSDVGRDMQELETGEPFSPISGVTFHDGKNDVASAGDGTGRVLRVLCPWATGEIAADVLAAIQGGVYQPWEAAHAVLDPAVELGDRVGVNGVQSVVARMDVAFTGLMTTTAAAPFDEEVDHEIPSVDKTLHKLENEIANNQAVLWTGIELADHLSTSKKISKYLLGDTSEDDFVVIRGQSFRWIRARTDGSEEQLTDVDGRPLYWDPDVERAEVGVDGHYYIGTEKVKPTIVETPYPVMCYAYEEQEIASWKFRSVRNPDGTTAFLPNITMGVGTDPTGETENGKFRITKHFTGADLEYQTSEGKIAGAFFRDDGFTDVTQRRAGVKIDTVNGVITVTPEGSLMEPYDIYVTENEDGSLDLTWPDMQTFHMEVV